MSSFKQKNWFHYLLLFIGILCIAWSAIFIKMANITGLSSAFYRMFIGLVGILPLLAYRKRTITDWHSVQVAILCGTFFALDIALWNTSIMLTKAAISTLLANLAPVWVGLGAIFILKENPKRIFWVGTLLSITGVTLIVGIGKITTQSFSLGHFLALAASVFYGAYLITVRKGRSQLDTVTFTAISMAASVVILFVFCKAFSAPLTGFSTKTWLSLAGVGLISQLSGWLAINFALGYIKPTVASVSLLGQSVFTAILSVPVLGEFLSAGEIAGMAIVLTGIYLVNRRNLKK